MAAESSSSAPTASQVEKDPATYEQLAHLERSLNAVDNRLVCIQTHLSKPIYDQRTTVVNKIPNFWALVLEQAPPEIDQYIQPSDSAIFASCLKDFNVERFEVPASLPTDLYAPVSVSEEHDGIWGEPRSMKFTFEFAPNEWFEDTVIEKKFWFRYAKDGWSGHVSDPVQIRWKKGKDLTDGLLDAAVKLNIAEKKAAGDVSGQGKAKELPEATKIKSLLESTAGNPGFFAWFGYRGRNVTAEESAEAWQKTKTREKTATKENAQEDEEEDLEDMVEDMELEIFPGGDDLAVALAEDLWPEAIRYFTQAQEDYEDVLDDDDDDGEDDSGGDEDMEDEEDDVPDIRSLVKDSQRSNGPPSKRRKA